MIAPAGCFMLGFPKQPIDGRGKKDLTMATRRKKRSKKTAKRTTKRRVKRRAKARTVVLGTFKGVKNVTILAKTTKKK